jgi:ATP-dependent RNA/DNA helicase IGHMBP2
VDLAGHFGKLLELVALERAADEARFAESSARLSLAQRDARGLAIAQAEAVEKGVLSGRSLVAYERPGGAALEGARITAGSMVRVAPRRSVAQAEEAPSGVVARRTR